MTIAVTIQVHCHDPGSGLLRRSFKIGVDLGCVWPYHG